jgi:hypothetical protein
MVLREISIQRFLYDRLNEQAKPITILVVGKNDAKRNALCQTIMKNICKNDQTIEQRNPSPFVFYDSTELRLLAVREVDDNVLSKKCGYIVLMEDTSDLQKIWEATNCKQAISKFETFMTIFHNCAKDLEVLWIDAKSDSSLPSKKLFWSNFQYTEAPQSGSIKAGDVVYYLPEKISHINEVDDNDAIHIELPMVPGSMDPSHEAYCTIL